MQRSAAFMARRRPNEQLAIIQIPDECPYGLTRTDAVPLGRGIKDVQLLLLNKNGQLAGYR